MLKSIQMKSKKHLFPLKPFLISPLHDPKGKYLPLLKKSGRLLFNNYSQVFLGVSDKTSTETIKMLDKLGFIICQGDYSYGEGYRQALALGFKKNGQFFHCSDFDRIFHWVSSYPQELTKILKKGALADYLILGRTKRAFSTHPLSWQLTEKIDNILASKLLERKVDLYAGSAFFNIQAAKIILANSKEESFSVLLEWPLLIKKAGLKINYLAVEGYEWEDPDRFQKEIKKLGFQKWFERYDSFTEWKKRIELICQRTQRISEKLALLQR